MDIIFDKRDIDALRLIANRIGAEDTHFTTNERRILANRFHAILEHGIEAPTTPQPEQEPVEFCTDYHCTGDCGKHGFGVQHAHPAPDQGAEIERLKAELDKAKHIPMKYKRMAFNAELQKERDTLREQLEEERARGIHSCGPKCQQSGCVNRRLREQVRALSDFIQEWLGRQGSDNNYMTEKARAALAAVKGEQA